MSEPIPESIPTSMDPRSRRASKRVRTSKPNDPLASQAASLQNLFAQPDKEIKIPDSTSLTASKANGYTPPEIFHSVQGSSAGAGSGEFHVYKASRRREYERLRCMDEEVTQEQGEEVFQREKREREERDAEKTRKNREKRNKKKGRKGGANGEKVEEAAGGGGKIQPRVVVEKDEADGEKDGAPGESKETAEEVGLIIHDDD